MLGAELFRSTQAFVCVVEAQSFVGAARRLNITPSAVSKQVARLEQHLGVRLLQRTTRSLSPTEEGTQYHRRCAAILSDLEAANREAASNDPIPRGLLRITAPTLLGYAFVARVLSEFQARFPEVTVDLDLSDRMVDIVDEGYDVAIRSSAQLPSSSLVAKKLAPHEFIMCASPSYIRDHGEPKRPSDLSLHRCLMRRGTDRDDVWTMVGPTGPCDVAVHGHFYSNSRIAIHQATLAGAGVALLPHYLVDDAIKDGTLVHILPDYRLADRWVYAVYAHRQSLPGKLRAFLDFISERAPELLGTRTIRAVETPPALAKAV